ncbi:carboxypeptidase B-like isoform X2 [Rhodnius prolixus]
MKFILFIISVISLNKDSLEREITPFRDTLFGYNFKPASSYILNKYNSADQINEYLEQLEKQFPKLVTLETIGQSVEGRPIKAVRISNSKVPDKPAILIDAGIHAREWIAPAVALYIIHALVENSEQNINLTNSIEWHIIPLLNPDGYEFSRIEDRMWRKNRAKTSDPFCPGVDLNRNFDLYFGGNGTSIDPCDETFIGTGPFSEPETRALRDYALKLRNVKLYLTLHSYGKYFLYPWGFGEELPRDWKDLDRLARYAEKALSSVYGTRYRVGSSTQLLGAAAGGSDDWMKAKAGVKYSYTVELPGGGELGFDLPPRQIPFVTKETFEAIKLLGYFIANQGLR